NHRQLKARAKNRLIPTREESARIGCFKLRCEHDFFRTAAVFLVRHIEKSLALLIDLVGKAKGDSVLTGWKLRRQRESEQLAFLVDFNRSVWQRFAIDRHVCDLELKRIQHELTNRTPHTELHRFRPSEGELFDSGDNPNGIFYGDDLFRQFPRRFLKVKR